MNYVAGNMILIDMYQISKQENHWLMSIRVAIGIMAQKPQRYASIKMDTGYQLTNAKNIQK